MMGGPGGGGGGQASVADAEATGGASSKAKSVRMAVADKGTTGGQVQQAADLTRLAAAFQGRMDRLVLQAT